MKLDSQILINRSHHDWIRIPPTYHLDGQRLVPMKSDSIEFLNRVTRQKISIEKEKVFSFKHIKCPDCNGTCGIKTRIESLSGIDYILLFYRCYDCKNTFTTTETDEVSLSFIFKHKRRIRSIIHFIKESFKKKSRKPL